MRAAELVRGYGIAREVKTTEACVALEPALARRRDWIVGGTYTATDETGDTRKFTQALAALGAKRGRIRPLSYYTDVRRALEVKNELGYEMADKITIRQLEQLLAKVEDRASGPTANRFHALLSSVFSYGVRSKLVKTNPMPQVPKYKENKSRIRYLDADEEAAIRRAIRERYPNREPEFDLALYTGLRRGEQYNAKWVGVDLDRGIITVDGERGCKTGWREVELNSVAVEALRQLHAISGGSTYVVPDGGRTHDGRDHRMWFLECVRASRVENFHWHDLRHTFASRAVMAGVDLPTVQTWLGHKSIVMTMKYAHLAPNHRKEQIEKIVGTNLDTSKGDVLQISKMKAVKVS